jgi:hypothetical protein
MACLTKSLARLSLRRLLLWRCGSRATYSHSRYSSHNTSERSSSAEAIVQN